MFLFTCHYVPTCQHTRVFSRQHRLVVLVRVGQVHFRHVRNLSSGFSPQCLTYIHTYILTHSMKQSPSWEADWFSVKKFPTFYGTRRFITAFTSARHLSLSWASSIHSTPPHPISWRSILILSFHLRPFSQVVSFPQVSPPKHGIYHSSHPYALNPAPISFSP